MSDSEENRGQTLKENLIDLFKSARVWVLIAFIILSLVAINWTFNPQGVAIVGIEPGSDADRAGMSFDGDANPRNYEHILSINGLDIESPGKFHQVMENNTEFRIITDQYSQGYEFEVDENATSPYGISVDDAATSNIRLGIELQGGSRLLLEPKQNLTDDEFDALVENLQSRLDVYGAGGTTVTRIDDAFTGESYVSVESLSSDADEIYSLISTPGEFKAKLGGELVFTGEDISRVMRGSDNIRLEDCSESGGEHICTYAFSIEIYTEASEKFYQVAQDLDVVDGRLSENIFFYLDGEEFTNLTVSSAFKYDRITTPQISVSGDPQPNEEDAIASARANMEEMQAILSTDALPSELEVLQSYSISSSRGENLLSNALLVGLLALVAVASVVAFRYREIKVFIGIFLALLAELIIIFGVAAFLNLSIDLAAIGGLIAAIGTGVDDQIIITDEYFRKNNAKVSSRRRVKYAIAIILVAFATTLMAMVPLYFAGLQILQGFAFMIIVGVTIGVLITRPFYAALLRLLMTNRKQRFEEDQDEK